MAASGFLTITSAMFPILFRIIGGSRCAFTEPAHRDPRTGRRLSFDGLLAGADGTRAPGSCPWQSSAQCFSGGARRSARDFEAFLTHIYMDAGARAGFKANQRAEARRAGLSDEECTALENTDWVGLEMAARSFARKRALKRKEHPRNSFKDTLQNLLATLSTAFR